MRSLNTMTDSLDSLDKQSGDHRSLIGAIRKALFNHAMTFEQDDCTTALTTLDRDGLEAAEEQLTSIADLCTTYDEYLQFVKQADPDDRTAFSPKQ